MAPTLKTGSDEVSTDKKKLVEVKKRISQRSKPSRKDIEPKKSVPKKSKVSNTKEAVSEASGNENSENGESEKEKKKSPMTKKKLGKAKKSALQRSKAKRKLETDSESSDDEAEKMALKNSKVSKRIDTYSDGENFTESENDTSSSESTWSKGKEILPDENEGGREVRLLQCNDCKKEFKLYAALVRHQKIHNTLKYKCVLCGGKFEYRTAYGNHMKKEHAEVEAFPCDHPKCQKSYHTQKKLRDHEKSHLKYMCRFCKRGYGSKRLRQNHIEKMHF